MVLFRRNIKKIKCVAHKNSDVNGTCEQGIIVFKN